MIDVMQEITAGGKTYPLRMDFNVLNWAQKKYGRIGTWMEKLDASSNYDGFDKGDYRNLEKFGMDYAPNKAGMIKLLKDAGTIANRYFDRQRSDDIREAIKIMLDKNELLEPEEPEIDLQVVLDSFTEMINEGIEYENYTKGENRQLINEKICGYILTDMGIQEAAGTIRQVIVESVGGKDDNGSNDIEKNA